MIVLNILTVCILFLFVVHAFSKNPKLFDKYFANITIKDGRNYEEEGRDEYYINKVTKKGLVIGQRSDIIREYHVEDDPYTLYSVLYMFGKPFICELGSMELNKMFIIEKMVEDLVKYNGVKNCFDDYDDELKCDVWSSEDDTVMYFAQKENGFPVRVYFVRYKLDFLVFNDFKSGEKSFDDDAMFKMPMDKTKCKHIP